MSSGDDHPRDEADRTAFDRFMRFGRALFAVKKDELPKRAERAKPKRSPKKPKPAQGA